MFGHSFGAGVALEFAKAHPDVRRIVLIAPFTSLYAMAYRMVGPVALLLHHNFDNAAVLKGLAMRNPKPSVVVFHGTRDQVIPVAMSRSLAADNPWLIYHEMPGYDHNQIVSRAAPQIAEAMAQIERQ